MPVGEKQTYHFGPFELDAQCGQLRKEGVGLKLQGQPVQILEILLQKPGELVTREELREQVWAPDTFVDFDHSLNTAIKKLRQALGDDADAPHYIETLPRRGYRFIGEVAAQDSVHQDSAMPQQLEDIVNKVATTLADAAITAATTSRRRGRWFSWIVASTVFLLAVSTVYWFRRPLPMPHIVDSHVLTKSKRPKHSLLLTDSTNLYFQEKGPGDLKTMHVRLTGGEAAELKIRAGNVVYIGGYFGSLHDISMDGSELLLSVYDRDAHRFDAWIQPLPAGSPRLVVKDARWPVFHPDGQRILFVRNDMDLYQVNADGTQPLQLATFPDLSGLAISPDGQRVRGYVYPTGTIWEGGADGSNPHRIFTEHRESITQGNWSPDGKYFIFPSFDGDRYNLWVGAEKRFWLRSTPRQLQQLTFGPLGYGLPTVSKDGRHLYAVGREPRGQLSVYDRHSGHFVPYLNGVSACFVDYSRDNKWVAYVSYPEGTLWRSRLDGSEQRQLTVPPLAVVNPRWSPDGKLIAFTEVSRGDRRSMSPGKPRVYIISAEGGGPLLLVGEQEGGGSDPTWSPDGTLIAYGGATSQEIKLLDLTRQKSVKIPGSEGMWSPRWSPNGKYLVALKGGILRKEYLFSFDTQEWKELSPLSFDWPSWSRDSKFVYAMGDGMVRISIPAGRIEKVGPIPDFITAFAFGGAGWFGITPDGRPLTTLDTGIEEIYAFDLEYK